MSVCLCLCGGGRASAALDPEVAGALVKGLHQCRAITNLLPGASGLLPRPPGSLSASHLWYLPHGESVLPSDLSFDSSDLVMLKSLLAGLSLPSRDGRADRGLDEEGEGECGPRGFYQEGASGLAALRTILVSLWCVPAAAGQGTAMCV